VGGRGGDFVFYLGGGGGGGGVGGVELGGVGWFGDVVGAGCCVGSGGVFEGWVPLASNPPNSGSRASTLDRRGTKGIDKRAGGSGVRSISYTGAREGREK